MEDVLTAVLHCYWQIQLANGSSAYATPWPKSVVGIDMRCSKCKKHCMTHDPKYVSSLPSFKRDFVTAKGNGTHMSLVRLLRSGMTVAQVERFVEEEVQEHYLRLKSEYIALWDKVKNSLFLRQLPLLFLVLMKVLS